MAGKFRKKDEGAAKAPESEEKLEVEGIEELEDIEELEAEVVDELKLEHQDEDADCRTEDESRKCSDGEDDAEQSEDEKTPIEVELAIAKKLGAEAQDRYLRLQAEWDNFRKRETAEREQTRVRATEKLMSDLLPVLDDLERAIDHAKEAGDGGTLTDGVEAIRSKTLTILAKYKLVEIEAEGKALDLEKHQAVSTQENADVPEETVLNVFQKGYMLGEKVLRPAMVITSVGGPAREKENAKDND